MAADHDRREPFDAVREVLNRADPEGLLAAGAPEDEYEPEAEDLAGRLRAGSPITPGTFVAVWERWFGPGSSLVRRSPTSRISALAAELDAHR